MTDPSDANIVKTPLIRSGVDHASRVAVCIELYSRDYSGNDRKIGSATGFFHRRWDRDFLITNWHVASGRNPDNPGELLSGYPDSPSSFQLYLPTGDDPNHFMPSELFSLYNSGKPSWIETTLEGATTAKRIDLVAIPFDFSDTKNPPLIARVEEFAQSEKDGLRAGRDVVIVGYPFGIRPENPYPIWKRGFVASEPSILVAGQPKYYIDTPGRPGMSGSPVFMISKGIRVSKKTHDLFAQDTKGAALAAIRCLDAEDILNAPEVNLMQFAGVYSGSVGDQVLDQLRVGVAWHAAMVDRLFTHPSEGSNPFPPTS